jgi:hypothetical protein
MHEGGGIEMSLQKGKLKSLASAVALGFALLAFGPATSTAKAAPVSARAAFHGGHVHGGHGHFHGHAAVRPYYGARFAYGYPYPYAYPYSPYAAPFRIVRVFVPLPFPHWVNQRVYAPYPY